VHVTRDVRERFEEKIQKFADMTLDLAISHGNAQTRASQWEFTSKLS